MQFGQLSVRWTSDQGVIAQRNHVLIVNYRGAITQALMDATESAQKSILTAYGSGCLMLSVIENGLPLPDEEARTTIVAHFKRVSEKNAAFATALLGDGFWAGAARSLLSGFSLVVRAACPNGTFADVPTSAKFLSEHTGGHVLDLAGLVADVETMRTAAQRAPLTLS